MKDVTPYVGIDAHKKDLFVALLLGARDDAGDVAVGQRTAGGATAGAEARARGAGPSAGVLRSGPLRVCVTATDDDLADDVRRRSAGVDSPQVRRSRENESTRCAQARRARPRGPADDGPSTHACAEAVRDLCRAREDAREDLQRAPPSARQAVAPSRAALQRAQLDAPAPAVDRPPRAGPTPPTRSWWRTICWRSITRTRGSGRSISRSPRLPPPSPTARPWAGCAVFGASTP